jgi:hypothetical protein
MSDFKRWSEAHLVLPGMASEPARVDGLDETFPASRVKRLSLDAILLPRGVSPATCLPEWIRVVSVQGTSSLDVRFAPEVVELVKGGFWVAETIVSGSVSSVIDAARENARRAAAAADPLPPDLQAPGRAFGFQR